MKNMILSACLALAVSGCAQQSFVMSADKSQLSEETSQHFFVEGIGQTKELNAAEICGGVENVSKVEVQQTFANGLLSAVTFGIYTPRDARVYCKS